MKNPFVGQLTESPAQLAVAGATVAGLLLLAASVGLQFRILREIQSRGTTQRPLEVAVGDPIAIGEPIAVDGPVTIEVGYGTTLPVELSEISTTDELQVNVQGHSLYGSEPIPVQVSP